MHLLLVSATEFELNETAIWLNQSTTYPNTPKAELLISGVGQLKTCFSLLKKIQVKRPDLVIQAGVGGATIKEDIGKVYTIQSEILADLGLVEKSGFTSIFGMGLENPDDFPFTKGKLMNPYQHLMEWTGLPLIDGMTVNEIRSSDFAGFQRNVVPVVESMEGAAVHYLCLMEKIPFLQVRSVSNVIGERNKTYWKLNEAVKKLNEELILMIQKLENAETTLFRI